MEPNQTQDSMKVEEASASLGLSNRMVEQLLMAQHGQEPDMTTGGQEIPPQSDQQPSMDSKPVDVDAIKNDIMVTVKELIKQEIGGIREDIKAALAEQTDEPKE